MRKASTAIAMTRDTASFIYPCKVAKLHITQCFLPPPWSIEELNDACFVVRDSNGQQLAYVYYEDEPQRRAAAKLLTKDEARRIAANVVKLRDKP